MKTLLNTLYSGAARHCILASGLALWLVGALSLPLIAPVPCAWAASAQATVLSGKVVTTVTRAEALPFNAIVDEVLVKPGEEIQAEAPLMRYHLPEEAERLLQKEVTLGAGTEEMRGQVLDLERRLAEAIAQRNKTRQLVASKLGSAQALGRLEGDVTSLQQRIALMRTTIKKTEASFAGRLDELSGYFGSKITEGCILPHNLVLSAPIGGYVLSVASNLYPGTLLPAGTQPISVGQLNPMLIQVQVYEGELNRIKEGDVAMVQIPSLQDKEFNAQVSKIAWTSGDMNVGNPSFYTVELTVPNPTLELKPGFKAVVHFNKAPTRN